jgi:hypothetical protein
MYLKLEILGSYFESSENNDIGKIPSEPATIIPSSY